MEEEAREKREERGREGGDKTLPPCHIFSSASPPPLLWLLPLSSSSASLSPFPSLIWLFPLEKEGQKRGREDMIEEGMERGREWEKADICGTCGDKNIVIMYIPKHHCVASICYTV